MSTTTLESSPCLNESSIASHAGAAFFCEQIVAQGFRSESNSNVLVAGCGSGHEAIAIAEELRCRVEAVDVEDYVDPSHHQQSKVKFQVASTLADRTISQVQVCRFTSLWFSTAGHQPCDLLVCCSLDLRSLQAKLKRKKKNTAAQNRLRCVVVR